jgi:hypothetical protein
MAAIIYSLCALLSFGIAALLWRHYASTRSRVLYWSALCFSGLTINNVLLVVDKLVLPDADLSPFRQIAALLSLLLLLFGLIYEDE